VDFVVVGFGLGGLAIVLGLMLGWAAASRDRAALQAALPEGAARDRALARDRRGAGQALLSAGGAVLIATIGALAGGLDDQTGAFFVTTTATVATLGILVWAYLHRSRHPAPPRARRQPQAVLATAPESAPPAAAALLATWEETTDDAERTIAWDPLAAAYGQPEAPSGDDQPAQPEQTEDHRSSDDRDDAGADPAHPLAGAANGSLNGRAEPPDASPQPPTDLGRDRDLEPLAPLTHGTAPAATKLEGE
jgi:hypothetical protein